MIGDTLYQYVRDFTVQIRRTTDNVIVGTGIIVSTDGKVVTCGHVVVAAGVNPRTGRNYPKTWELIIEDIFKKKPDVLTDVKDAEVVVYFPELARDEEKERRATVAACFPAHDDDVVLLQLIDPPRLTLEQVAVLGTAKGSRHNEFESFGYRVLGNYEGLLADGIIQGIVPAASARKVRADLVQLKSSQINEGMSGAAVLDIKRDLVVGIISETTSVDRSAKDRDTNWAVDACVLAFNPFNLPVQDAPHPKRPAPQQKIDITITQEVASPTESIAWNSAPPSLVEWIGREKLLQDINSDWADSGCLMTSLIGFGGEGKSSLARKWLDDLLANSSQPQPDGLFWWDCYNRPNIDEFFEEGLKWITGGRIDPNDYPSPTARAHLIAATLSKGRYIFILDGLEVMQHRQGDRYGKVMSIHLRDFLIYFAAPVHNSFCLITSRVPLTDRNIMNSITHKRRDVTRLNLGEGRSLLQKLGVNGPNRALDQVVSNWDGHALTLTLLGTYLVEHYQGDVAYINDIPSPAADEPHYQRVHRVLRQYDQSLSNLEQAALMLISLLRGLIAPTVAFGPVVSDWLLPDVLAPLKGVDKETLNELINRLVTYRILRYDEHREVISVHPLVRSHYREQLNAYGEATTGDVHRMVAAAYMAYGEINVDEWKRRAENLTDIGSLEELRPAIEAIYHYCRAGEYKEAHAINQLWINRNLETNWISVRLGSSEVALDVCLNFFPDRNFANNPAPGLLTYLSATGVQLNNLGRTDDALTLFKRAYEAGIRDERWYLAQTALQNLADIAIQTGNLSMAAQSADETLQIYEKIEAEEDDRVSMLDKLQDLATSAWIATLRGDNGTAAILFNEVVQMSSQLYPSLKAPMGEAGLRYAEYLLRIGNFTRAAEILDECLTFAEYLRRIGFKVWCHRLGGKLYVQIGNELSGEDASEVLVKARTEFNTAVTIANKATEYDRVEALIARGIWAAKIGDVELAQQDLQEALDRSSAAGFRLKQVDAYTGQAWLYITKNRYDLARNAAELALSISRSAEYAWGQLDAENVLAFLSEKESSGIYKTIWNKLKGIVKKGSENGVNP
jgi:tetratricopeptide (TPR) repeat protein